MPKIDFSEQVQRLEDEGLLEMAQFSQDATRDAVLMTLVEICLAKGWPIDRHVCSCAADRVMAHIQKVMHFPSGITLTVGQLRKSLEGLPDYMPVAYQRIQDVYFNKHGWKPLCMPYGAPQELTLEEYHELLSGPPERISECSLYQENGKCFLQPLSDYIPAFCGYAKEHDGKKIFVVEAHY